MGTARLAAAAGVAALLATGCSISDPSNANTDHFSGTIQPGDFTGRVYSFTVGSNGGEVTVTVASVSPDSGTALGLAYGQFATGSTSECIPIRSGVGLQGQQAISNVITTGTYCLRVFDAGFLSQRAETFTVDVSHP